MKRETAILNLEKIDAINQGLQTLRHFITLSSKLLPFLHELMTLEKPSVEDIQNRNKIIHVYKSMEFDHSTSEILMNTSVLRQIENTFQHILNLHPHANRDLEKFQKEYRKLINDWFVIDMN